MFLPVVVAGREEGVVVGHQRGGDRRDILGQLVLEVRAVGDMDLADAGDLRGRIGDRADALAGDQQMDFAELRGGGDRGERRVLDRAAVMFDQNQRLHAATPSAFSLPTSSSTEPTLIAGLALGRLGDLQRFQPRRDVDAVIAGRLGRQRLRLGLHDVGQRGVARLVEAQVGGDHRRQLQLHRLQPAVDLAGDVDVAARRPRPSRRRCPAASRAGRRASGRSGCCRRRSPACRG